MPEICITDHQDFDFPPGDLDFKMVIEDFFTTMPQLQAKYADQIQLRLGVKLGLAVKF